MQTSVGLQTRRNMSEPFHRSDRLPSSPIAIGIGLPIAPDPRVPADGEQREFIGGMNDSGHILEVVATRQRFPFRSQICRIAGPVHRDGCAFTDADVDESAIGKDQ